ncbi:hypothetical protein [Nocardiopsis sp. MG754419]|uniref:hypothetical protein n=1 Tax=Nocardiopsis sp. MG754419 TaxID=2259865 RepID=UPI001BAC4252|nr:hypothetical protein [Nocardiopsis sp. MG754419]MBR8743701.1 hypothetical protein [Nocardiopsis sp. MG754419]
MGRDYDAHDAEDDAEIASRLLWAAVQTIRGDVEALGRVVVLLAVMETPNLLGVMSGWVAGTELLAPRPQGAAARADHEPRTGQVWELEHGDRGVVIGHRIFAALTNQDTETASALWDAAHLPDEQGEAVVQDALLTVLRRCALIIARQGGSGTAA